MAPLSTPRGASKSAKMTSIESLLADVENSTANFVPPHLVEPTASTPDPAPTTKQTLAGSSGRKRMILGDRAANDLISSRKNVKVQGQGDKENERPTQSQNQEFVPRRFWDSETSRNWIDCSHCRGEGEKYAGTPWREHDREGANKRVNAHTKNIKVKCTYCRFWYEKWGLIGSLPSK